MAVEKMKKSFKFVFDGVESCQDLDWNPKIHDGEYTSLRQLVSSVVGESGKKTHRNIPKKIAVEILELQIVKGEMKQRHYCTLEVDLPVAPLTTDEFNDESNTILEDVPEEFHKALCKMAWDQGHSSGYESVLSYLDDLVSEMKDPIKQYTERLSKTTKKKK